MEKASSSKHFDKYVKLFDTELEKKWESSSDEWRHETLVIWNVLTRLPPLAQLSCLGSDWRHSEALLISRGDHWSCHPTSSIPPLDRCPQVKLSLSAAMPSDYQQGSSGSVSTDLVIDFVAGGLGAAASVIVGQPLDTVKVGCCNASQDMMTYGNKTSQKRASLIPSYD